MGTYEQLKRAIGQVITTNGRQEITGKVMRETLWGIMDAIGKGAIFAGVATPATTPGTPDANTFYIAGRGVYPNFGGAAVSNLAVFVTEGNVWKKQEIETNTLHVANFKELDSLTNPKDTGIYDLRLTSDRNLSYGTLLINSDGGHVVNQILISNQTIKNGEIDGTHAHGKMHIAFRVYAASSAATPLTPKTWTEWQYYDAVTHDELSAALLDKVDIDLFTTAIEDLEIAVNTKEDKSQTTAHLTQRFNGFVDIQMPSIPQSTQDENAEVYFNRNNKLFVFKSGGQFYANAPKRGDEYYNDGVKGIRKDKTYICDGEVYVYDVSGLKKVSEALPSRAANADEFSSLGRVYLPKNIKMIGGKAVNVLEQDMINQPNTIYVVQYDFDLNKATIEMQPNCVLQFEGGSLKNGTLGGNETKILENSSQIFNKTIKLTGTWKDIVLYPENFGVISGVDTDFVDEFQSLANNTPNGGKVKFGECKEYYFRYRENSEVQTKPTRMVFFDKKNLEIDGCNAIIHFVGYSIEKLNSQQDPGNGSGRDIFTFIQFLNCENCYTHNFRGIGDYIPFSGRLIYTPTSCNPRGKFMGVMGSKNIFFKNINTTNIIGNAIHGTPSGSNDYPEGGKIKSKPSSCININTTDCVIDGCLEGGVNYQGNTHQGVVANCNISQCADGVEVGQGYSIIRNNNIHNCEIGISGTSNNIMILGNMIHDLRDIHDDTNAKVGRTAIFLTGKGEHEIDGMIVISNNEISHIPQIAVHMYAGNRNIVFTSNTFRDICYNPIDTYVFPIFLIGTDVAPISNIIFSNNIIFSDYKSRGSEKKDNIFILMRYCNNSIFNNNIFRTMSGISVPPLNIAKIEDSCYNISGDIIPFYTDETTDKKFERAKQLGHIVYNTTYKKLEIKTDKGPVDALGAKIDALHEGVMSARPSIDDVSEGYIYNNTELGYPEWACNGKWIKAFPIGGIYVQLYKSIGAVYNEESRMYEYNGVVDITQEQMMDIYVSETSSKYSFSEMSGCFVGSKARVIQLPPMYAQNTFTSEMPATKMVRTFFGNVLLECIKIIGKIKVANLNTTFMNCKKLKSIDGVLDVSDNTDFTRSFVSCSELENVKLSHLKKNVDLRDCIKLSVTDTDSSLQYMVDNASNSGAITITLHHDAFIKVSQELKDKASDKQITIVDATPA